ncbi:MAG: aspartate/glutamate racemase family protein [Pseudolabrys sp.]
MATLTQKLVPGIVGISTYVDFAYQREMQLAAVATAGTGGPINQLRTVTVTLDFNLLVANLQAKKRDAAEEQVAAAVQTLQIANADFVVVTSGTTSTLTRLARQRVSIPFLDLAAACFKPDCPAGPTGLLSTSLAAAGGLFQAAAKPHGAAVIIPSPETAKAVDAAIFGELVHGAASGPCMQVFRSAIDELTAAGAKSVILGNTDLTLIADDLQRSSTVPLIDSTRAHARDAARAALSGQL